jgi:hypothetical protein
MKQSIIATILLLIITTTHAQEKRRLSDFNFIINKIENDYPGYSDKVNVENVEALKRLESELRGKMMQYPDSSFIYLSEYTAWFKDHHLRVSHNRSHQKSKRESEKKRYSEFNLESLSRKSNSLEGIWRGFRGSQ